MSDLPTHWLINQLAACQPHSIWFSDENILHALPLISRQAHLPLLICNRWDIAQQAQAQGLPAQFSDFDCKAIADNSQDQVFYRISKEKPVVHHILNQALRILKPEGELIICGQKNEGIKTYIEKTRTLFHSDARMHKEGTIYFTSMRKNLIAENVPVSLLDDSDYPQLRVIGELQGRPLYSKPGLFGWNKIDQGSALLIEQLTALFPTLLPAPASLLDLGCGYGYLALMTNHLTIERRVLTDNNAAALLAARENCAAHKLDAEIIAGDAGSTISDTFDVILCNPPFHQGFSVDGNLTDKFLAATKRLLAKSGTAVFVVNQFIPLERQAGAMFRNTRVIAQNRSFKIVTLRHD